MFLFRVRCICTHIPPKLERTFFAIVLLHSCELGICSRLQEPRHQKLLTNALKLQALLVQAIDFMHALHIRHLIDIIIDVRLIELVGLFRCADHQVDEDIVLFARHPTSAPLRGLVVPSNLNGLIQSCERISGNHGYLHGGG